VSAGVEAPAAVAAATFADIAAPARDEVLVVVGPTGSGKTELALDLAQKFGGEIIGADSVQIYREFDVGSGKPTSEQRRRVPHYLIDQIAPADRIDAAQFASLADEAIAQIRAKGLVPVVCGGTFLWIKALVAGLVPAPPADSAIRARHAALVEAEGRAALHARLAVVDPESAARLAPNDYVRVSRALEIHELSGRPQSAWFAEHGFRSARYPARLIGAFQPREELDRRIEARTQAWLEAGWIEEVRELLRRGRGDTRPMGSVGYQQVRDHVEGRLSREELQVAIVRATRVFARRQRTWLREEPVMWVQHGREALSATSAR
jgi:tRNA dimethylallyltransferase